MGALNRRPPDEAAESKGVADVAGGGQGGVKKTGRERELNTRASS